MKRSIGYSLAALLVLFIGIAACSDSGQRGEDQDIEALEGEVMEIHDEVMPRMADISALRNRLKRLRATDTANVALVSRIDQATERLDAADEAMMTWMHYYSDNLPEDLEEKRTFLEEEKTKIEAVRDQMLTSIQSAEEILKNAAADE